MSRPRNITALLVALACAFVPGFSAAAAPADPDPGFGAGGRVTTDFAGLSDNPHAIAIQPDGRIVAAGSANTGTAVQPNYDFAVARYLPNGALDPSFGGDGRVTTSFENAGFRDAAWDVAVQPDGKIVVAGGATKPGIGNQFAVVRYRPDGSLDPEFSSDGRQTFGFDNSSADDQALGLALDGTDIVVAGWSDQGSLSYQSAMARLTAGGALDPSFGVAGRMTFGVSGTGPFPDFARDLVRQPDGRYLVVGSGLVQGVGAATLHRFERSGELDSSFGEAGLQLTAFGVHGQADATASAAVMQGDGRLVVAGDAGGQGDPGHFGVARYLPNGQPDPSFSGDGFQLTPLSADGDAAYAVAVDGSGRLLVAGRANKLSASAVVRYRSDGTLDPEFGSGGVLISTDDESGAASAVAVQPDGKIVIAGYTGDGASSDFYLQRLQGGAATSGGTGTQPQGGSETGSQQSGETTVPSLRPTGPCANRLAGTRRADVLRGTAAGDRLLGGAGNDRLSGRRGADCLKGGRGRDRLLGGAGGDRLLGGPGRNTYRAGAGRDQINAVNGRRERLACGPGHDSVRADRVDRVLGCERVSRATRTG